MISLINIASFVIGIGGALIAVFVGSAEIRRLRKTTGDRSFVTYILGGLFLIKER